MRPRSIQRLSERVLTTFVVSLLVFAVASPQQGLTSQTVAIGLVAIALAAVVSVRYAAILLRAGEIRIGHRARKHREVLASAPAPRHPNTPGRIRSRAPARSLATA
jgi:hypothetical protein